MTKGLARAGWDIDLRDGEAREDAFVRVFLKSKVEHKRDYKCRSTGNVAIELRQHGRLSGLMTSTADWWAIEYDEDCWVIVPTRLLHALVKRALGEGRKKLCGDNNEFLNALVPIEWLVRPWKVVANATTR